jgi:hypothetical protein
MGWMLDGLEMGIFPLVARPALQSMMPSAAGLLQDQFVGLSIAGELVRESAGTTAGCAGRRELPRTNAGYVRNL